MIFKLFGGANAKKKKKLDAQQLPAIHAFVDVTVMGRSMKSVSIEDIGEKEIVTGEALGRAGETAAFIYQNEHGRFRFSTRVVGFGGGRTRFELPAFIEPLGGGTEDGQKRASLRLDTLVPGFWRFAPSCQGVGEFMKGSVRDISRGGCSLITDRRFKIGQMLELKLQLRADFAPLQVFGEVVRVEQIPTSGKFSHGLRLHGTREDEERAILQFIHRRQADLRNRGLA